MRETTEISLCIIKPLLETHSINDPTKEVTKKSGLHLQLYLGTTFCDTGTTWGLPRTAT